MQTQNKKAMRKLEKEIASDEVEIEKYEASGKEGSDGDDDDLTSERKKKHIKQVSNFLSFEQKRWSTISEKQRCFLMT